MFCIGNLLLRMFALEGFVKARPVGMTDSYKNVELYLCFCDSFQHISLVLTCAASLGLVVYKVPVSRTNTTSLGLVLYKVPVSRTNTNVSQLQKGIES